MKNNGFSLVGLIVVIVILGVLAVSAVPKFMGMATDTRVASLEGLQGALKTGVKIAFSKTLILKLSESGITENGGD